MINDELMTTARRDLCLITCRHVGKQTMVARVAPAREREGLSQRTKERQTPSLIKRATTFSNLLSPRAAQQASPAPKQPRGCRACSNHRGAQSHSAPFRHTRRSHAIALVSVASVVVDPSVRRQTVCQYSIKFETNLSPQSTKRIRRQLSASRRRANDAADSQTRLQPSSLMSPAIPTKRAICQGKCSRGTRTTGRHD